MSLSLQDTCTAEFLSCHFFSITFDCHLSQFPVATANSGTRLTSNSCAWKDGVTKLNWTLLYNHVTRTTQKTQPLYCWECMFTAPLSSNGSYSIVACVFVAAGMCLPSSCLAMVVSSDFTIPVLGRHVPICFCSTRWWTHAVKTCHKKEIINKC
jgi:hypothetical protein